MKKLLLLPLILFNIFLKGQSLQEYYFNNSLAGTGGGGNLTQLVSCGAVQGAFGTDSIITSNGLCSVSTAFCFNPGGGFSYPNTSITGTYSINVFFKFSTLGGWSRIIDFSNSTLDAGFYLLNNCLNFFPNGNVGTCPYFNPNIYYLFTFVRDGSTNVISAYVNGTLFGTYNDTGNVYTPATTSTPIIFFRDDNTVTCEDKAGCIRYASVSQQLLTPAEVDSIWVNICAITLPPCSATIAYPGSPFSDAITTPQPVTQTGNTGGHYHSAPGLTIDSLTGAVTPSTSTAGVYTVTYTVADSGVCSPISTTASVTIISSSFTCNPNGNTIIFSNYDGGVLNINVDVNIPNLKIGVVTYEPVTINLTGPYAANVTKVLRAGFPNTNNNNCGLGVFTTTINGPVPANYSISNIPPVGLSNPNGYASGIICATSCDVTTYQGGCNTLDQVLDYFNTQLSGTVYSISAQYCCWKPQATYSVSTLANMCCSTTPTQTIISYPASQLCQSDSSLHHPIVLGNHNGYYNSVQFGLSIDPATGAINPSASLPGTYTVFYTIAGCPDGYATTLVSVASQPTASISYASSAFCTGAAVQQATINGTTGGVFSAGVGLSIDSLTGNLDPSASSSGSYTVTYTVSGGGICPSSESFADVNILETISTPISQAICPGQTYTFAGHLYNSAGTYSDTTQTAAGCDSVTNLTLTISNPPNAAITSGTNIFCPGDSAQICAPSGLSTYQWNTGATASCTNAFNAGNYYVTVTDANSCTAESNHISMSVYQLPAVSLSVNGDTLNAYNANSYQWYLNGGEITGANSSSYVALTAGSYQVQISDTNGCRATSNAIQITPTGIAEIVSEDFNVHPNPLESGMWNLECGNSMLGSTFEIFDASGRVVFKSEIHNPKFEINFTGAKGVYYLRVNSVVKKLVHL